MIERFRFAWRIIELSALVSVFASPAVHADPPIYAEVYGSFGLVRATNLVNDAAAPTIVSPAIGMTIGVPVAGYLLAGASVDYQIYEQLSSYQAQTGDYNATRLVYASPTFGVFLNRLTLRAELELLGTYVFSNPTASGSSVSYTHPMGGKIMGEWNLSGGLLLGAQFEIVHYSDLEDSTTGVVTLPGRFTTTSYGLVVGFRL